MFDTNICCCCLCVCVYVCMLFANKVMVFSVVNKMHFARLIQRNVRIRELHVLNVLKQLIIYWVIIDRVFIERKLFFIIEHSFKCSKTRDKRNIDYKNKTPKICIDWHVLNSMLLNHALKPLLILFSTKNS